MMAISSEKDDGKRPRPPARYSLDSEGKNQLEMLCKNVFRIRDLRDQESHENLPVNCATGLQESAQLAPAQSARVDLPVS